MKLITNLGDLVMRFVDGLGQVTIFGAQITACTLRPPLRVKVLIKEIYRIGVLSVSIIAISGLAVGMVLSLQGYNTLVRFGASNALGGMVGLSLIRELGPVLAALLVTGRAGSATTAEIGAMVATEQLDGLRMMSVNPIDIVVSPKFIAMIIAVPLLTAMFNVLGIFGGYVVGVGMMGLDAGIYMSGLTSAVAFGDDVMGSVVKSLAFGGLIGLISTWRGYTAAPTSAGVSAATTSTVVVASLSILIFDFFITALWGYS